MYTTLLMLHLSGAAITGMVALFSIVALVRNTERHYRPAARVLGMLAGFEIATGILLSIVSAQITALSLCNNIVAYLSFVTIVETLLYIRMRQSALVFPLRFVLSPTLVGVVLLCASISYGF